MVHCPERGHMATATCKGGWEIKLSALPTSIVKVVKMHSSTIKYLGNHSLRVEAHCSHCKAWMTFSDELEQ